MRETHHCRRCESFRSSAIRAASRGTFWVPEAKPRYAPDLPFRLEHLKLEVELDPRVRFVKGRITQRLAVVASGQERIRLDQIGLRVHGAKVDGVDAGFSVEGEQLWVTVPGGARAPGQTLQVQVDYEVRDPRRGLYFTGPDQDQPAKRHQVWSQGQDEDNRHWMPLLDYPNQKATTEMVAKVPRGFTAVSNGALVSCQEEGDWTIWHYRLGSPQVTYLISLVVAEFSAWEDEGPRGLPVQYFVAPGREADGKRAFGNTPRMIEAFEKRTGIAYPFEKYSQVAVQDFIFGGMENTSATTQTELTLHDERSHPEATSDPLVSHELAHQWFGDLVTCRDWSHGWLNEGFATFLERVWVEENVADAGSAEQAREEAKYYSYQDWKEHLEEDSSRYRRPIVCNAYIEPIDLFDTHLYQKGGLVLNLLRAELGEESFWRVIRHYLEKHRGGSVETLDLIRAIEDVTGRNLRRFFDQWIFGAGYPEFELSTQWHESQKLAELVIEQKQTDGQPEKREGGAVTPVFDVVVRVQFLCAAGETVERELRVSELRERVFLPVPSRPLAVIFDPGHVIPKKLKFQRPRDLLVHQLHHAADCMARIEAAQSLVEEASLQAVEALGRQLLQDPFWGVQAEVAAALARIRMDASRDALIAALKLKHPKARRAVVKALGTFQDAKAATALRALAQSDPSYYVESEAILAFARARTGTSVRRLEDPAARHAADEAEVFLMECLGRESHAEVIRAGALQALAGLPGVGRGERPAALGALLEWTRRGRALNARIAAVGALGGLCRVAVPAEQHRILEVFSSLADEDNFRLRRALVAALGEAGLADGIAILERIRRLDGDGRVKRQAMAMADALATAGASGATFGELREQIRKLEDEGRKLRSQLEELRAGLGTGVGPG